MKVCKKSIADHYGRTNLGTGILAAYERAGKEIKTYEDTASFDEFHIRGRDATRELARLAELQKGMNVLDLGCGVGGPARTLAAEFGCRVTGIDLVEEYCRTAEMLTEQVGLSGMVTFRHADMNDLPFEKQSFDAVWAEHVFMNIPDKEKLFRRVGPVLRAGGRFVLYEICTGSDSPPHYPVPWATDSNISFLVTAERLRHLLMKIGFRQLHWRDVTAACLKWFNDVSSHRDARRKDAPPRLGLNLLMGKSAGVQARNLVRNLKEDRVRVVQGVLESPAI